MSEDHSAGFTVKEMLVRVETKVDVVLADHEARIRRLEEEAAQEAGEDTFARRNSASIIAWAAICLAGAGDILLIVTHYFK